MIKVIAVDFDGTIVTDEYPNIGKPIASTIKRLKEEQENGTLIVLWTCREGEDLKKAIEYCEQHGVHIHAANQNVPETISLYGTDPRKVSATEYWDDRSVYVGERDIGDFSDGYHTFNDLYTQRMMLSASLFNAYSNLAWKSYRHEDGTLCFGGGWFIVGIDTPQGSYTYHYKNEFWDLFHVPVLEVAKNWDGHTDKDVGRLLSLSKKKTQEQSRPLSNFERYQKGLNNK